MLSIMIAVTVRGQSFWQAKRNVFLSQLIAKSENLVRPERPRKNLSCVKNPEPLFFSQKQESHNKKIGSEFNTTSNHKTPMTSFIFIKKFNQYTTNFSFLIIKTFQIELIISWNVSKIKYSPKLFFFIKEYL